MKKQLLRNIPHYFFALSLFQSSLFACQTQAIEQQAEKKIRTLYSELKKQPEMSMSERIEWISRQFKGKPYLINALGEGLQSKYDQCPRYRTNAFDCLTFVTTVTALALSDNFKLFKNCLAEVRYQNGQFHYLKRNHFTSLDWNLNNQKKGFVKDYTLQIKDKHHQTVAVFATALIDKANWYQHKKLDTIRLAKQNYSLKKQRLTELKNAASHLKATKSTIAYIPLDKLFNSQGKARQYLFDQIPNSAIIEIVRPNWNLIQQIGTNLHVSHLGFAIRKNGILYYREASSTENKIIDIPLVDYLKQAQKSPTIKGINIQIIVQKKPFQIICRGEQH